MKRFKKPQVSDESIRIAKRNILKTRSALIPILSASILFTSLTALTCGTFAWFTYATHADASYDGISIGSRNIEIGYVSSVRFFEFAQFGLTEETYTDKYIYWFNDEATTDPLAMLINLNGYAFNLLKPVTTGRYNNNEGELFLYNAPAPGHEYDESFYAKTESYCKLPLAFRVASSLEPGSYLPNNPIYMSVAEVTSVYEIKEAMRIHTFDHHDNTHLINPTATSDGFDYVGGVLDLNKDGYYDFYDDEGDKKELLYGEFDASYAHKSSPRLGDSELFGEWTTFNAKHKAGVYEADLLASSPAKAEFECMEKFAKKYVPVTKTNEETNNYAFVDLTVFVEGWDTTVIDFDQVREFDLGLNFEVLIDQFMKAKKKIAFLSMLVGLTAMSVGLSTFAWYNGSSHLSVSNFNIRLADKRLLISTDNVEFKSHLAKEDLVEVDFFRPVSSMFMESWVNVKEEAPRFKRGFSHESITMDAYVLETDYATASEGYFVQSLYLKADVDGFVSIDSSLTSFEADSAKNKGVANKLLEMGRYSGIDVDALTNKLDDIIKSMRFMVLVLDEEDETGLDEYATYIIDPTKTDDTYYGGVLDNDGDGYYDYHDDKEVLFGEIDSGDTSLIVYDSMASISTPKVSHSVFDANTHQGVRHLNINASSENGLKLKKEHSLSMDELSNIKIPVRNGISRHICLAMYIEGWDIDNNNYTMYSSFKSNIGFTLEGGSN